MCVNEACSAVAVRPKLNTANKRYNRHNTKNVTRNIKHKILYKPRSNRHLIQKTTNDTSHKKLRTSFTHYSLHAKTSQIPTLPTRPCKRSSCENLRPECALLVPRHWSACA